MVNALEIKSKIIEIVKKRGPSLPVHVAKETGLTMLFASAFLSELFSDRTIKISSLKVGGSPLYFLPGQEHLLENFSNFLNSKEKEAFFHLKQNKFLKDSEQEPAIRVALRAIKDFAFPFQASGEVYWKFFSANESEFVEIKPKAIESQVEKITEEIKEVIKELPEEGLEMPKEKKKPKLKIPLEEKEKPLLTIKEKPLIEIKKEPKLEMPKEKSEFAVKVIEFLKSKDIEVLQEIDFKKKEFNCIVRINSDLGKIEFLSIAKDKKKVTESDLTLAVQKSNSLKKPVLFISTGDLDKKAKEFMDNYQNIIKFLKIE
ncbi:MAG: hypothetical protein KKA64_00570 [Nanoarchaeota archaeon]|nr:hypothetical protein [Nanoarchaeota archaeon]